MENNQDSRREKTIFVTALIVGQIIFIAIIAFIVSLFVHDEKISNVDYERQPKVVIENIKSFLPDATQDYSAVLGQKIAKTVESNAPNYDIFGSKATIRENTFKMTKLEKDNTSFYSMIIDIPNLQQSYQIYDVYSSDNEPANRMYVLCLDNPSEIIYPDFQCKDEYPLNMRSIIVNYYLPYFDFNYFSTFMEDNFTKIYINPTEYSPTEKEKETYLQETKEAVRSLGVSPDLFTYEIATPSDLTYQINQ
ncbi:hypothetical protein IKE80_02255 [Candidatus Saccharibacteria bacterium]|nr:hypothetical protein [Candidatus Saccharibacteria bacterium]